MATASFTYDPFSATVQEDPYPFYARLREAHPVYQTPGRGFWTLSRYADVQQASRDWETFSNARGVELDDAVDVYPETFGPGIVAWMDPPEHDRIRKVVHKSFTPRAIAELEAGVTAHVDRLLDELEDADAPDLARDFAWRLPALVISDLLGFPEADLSMLLGWIRAMEVRSVEGDLSEMSESARTAAGEIAAYMRESLDERRRNPRDDLLSLLVSAERSGQLLEGESRGLTFLFGVAGIDTTAGLLSNLLHRLAPLRDQRARIVAEPQRWPAAVEELVRYEAPVQGLARWTTRDVTLHDVTIPAGSWVFLAFGSANRDESVFQNADRLDFDRAPRRNLGFGDGIHHCLGAPLARLEGRVAAARFFARFPGYELTGEGRRVHQHTMRGWIELPALMA